MADPVSLVSSIVGLIAIGTKVSVQLHLFIESLRSAPREIRELSKSLEDLCSILRRLETVFSSGNNGALGNQGLLEDFDSVLDSCMDKFLQLKLLVETHLVKKDDGIWSRNWKRWRWVFQEKEAVMLMRQLEAHKATLNITLLMSAHTQATCVKSTAFRIEDTVREIRQMMLQDMGVDGDNGTTSATYNFAIERYLNSASSVFSSRPESPVSISSLDVIQEIGEMEALGITAAKNRTFERQNSQPSIRQQERPKVPLQRGRLGKAHPRNRRDKGPDVPTSSLVGQLHAIRNTQTFDNDAQKLDPRRAAQKPSNTYDDKDKRFEAGPSYAIDHNQPPSSARNHSQRNTPVLTNPIAIRGRTEKQAVTEEHPTYQGSPPRYWEIEYTTSEKVTASQVSHPAATILPTQPKKQQGKTSFLSSLLGRQKEKAKDTPKTPKSTRLPSSAAAEPTGKNKTRTSEEPPGGYGNYHSRQEALKTAVQKPSTVVPSPAHEEVLVTSLQQHRRGRTPAPPKDYTSESLREYSQETSHRQYSRSRSSGNPGPASQRYTQQNEQKSAENIPPKPPQHKVSVSKQPTRGRSISPTLRESTKTPPLRRQQHHPLQERYSQGLPPPHISEEYTVKTMPQQQQPEKRRTKENAPPLPQKPQEKQDQPQYSYGIPLPPPGEYTATVVQQVQQQYPLNLAQGQPQQIQSMRRTRNISPEPSQQIQLQQQYPELVLTQKRTGSRSPAPPSRDYQHHHEQDLSQKLQKQHTKELVRKSSLEYHHLHQEYPTRTPQKKYWKDSRWEPPKDYPQEHLSQEAHMQSTNDQGSSQYYQHQQQCLPQSQDRCVDDPRPESLKQRQPLEQEQYLQTPLRLDITRPVSQPCGSPPPSQENQCRRSRSSEL